MRRKKEWYEANGIEFKGFGEPYDEANEDLGLWRCGVADCTCENKEWARLTTGGIGANKKWDIENLRSGDRKGATKPAGVGHCLDARGRGRISDVSE